jgi:putative hemolysin
MRKSRGLVQVKLPVRTRIGKTLTWPVAAGVEKLLAFDHLNELYARASAGKGTDEFLRRVLGELDVTSHLPVVDLGHIPKSGAAVVVANHPFGALDGVLLAAVLRTVRPDVKIMVNYLLGRVEEMRELFILVDPFAREGSAIANVGPMREAMRWLDQGGLLAVFPAGEVAHWSPRSRRVEEPMWSGTIARMVRRAKAPVVPIYFEGANSPGFHAAGLLHPKLRTALMARELMNKSHRRVTVRVGSAVPFRRLEEFAEDGEMMGFLRQRTLMLRHRSEAGEAKLLAGPRGKMETIIEGVDGSLMEKDVAGLPADRVLAQTGESVALYARAGEIPNVLREIGRLREITFRATAEGTGKAVDLDEFDDDYVHLFVWDAKGKRVVGAYRLGETDRILPGKGRRGLYTSTLFDMNEEMTRRLTPGLELGRSFIRQEDQRGFTPLLLLWRGICTYVARNPRYRMLFGPVSISNDYQSVSQQLMVRFLMAHHSGAGLAEMVRPRNPFALREIAGCRAAEIEAMLQDCEDASELVAEMEPDEKGMPVLIRQYLKLGAEYLAFNVDPAFGNCVDGLIVVDLAKADAKQLDRYMGKEGRAAFLRHHGAIECRAHGAMV